MIYKLRGILILAALVDSTWWYLGISGVAYNQLTSNYRLQCEQLDMIVPKQRRICARNKHVMDVVAAGAALGIHECQRQFSSRRWNCTIFNSTDVFGPVLKLETREKAFIHAISSAAVMHSIVRACARGSLSLCSCDARASRKTSTGFKWGGCSHDVRYGAMFTRQFVDSGNNGEMPAKLVNLWNNAAGRKMVRKKMKLVCKCHGVSGSCTVRICWREVADFKVIGNALKNRFDGAYKVKLTANRNSKKKRSHSIKPIFKIQKTPSKRDLVYTDESPDFCVKNKLKGSMGTRNRRCKRFSRGVEGCELMCCGRGYHTMVTRVTKQCNCKFVWCCDVICDYCSTMEQHFFCN